MRALLLAFYLLCFFLGFCVGKLYPQTPAIERDILCAPENPELAHCKELVKVLREELDDIMNDIKTVSDRHESVRKHK